jgi:hypothetical protein
MDPIVLTDPTIQPTDELIFGIIGDNSVYWEKLVDYLYEKHLNISEEWRYYNDGKAWLYKAVRKKQTLYWIGVIKDTFRVTFYFGDKAEPVILESTLPDSIKEEFKNGKRYSQIRAISIEVRSDDDFTNVVKLLELKAKIK